MSAVTGVSQNAAAQNAGLTITVNVTNYAGVDAKTLASAEKFAKRVFQQAGVETRWVEVPIPSAELPAAAVDSIPVGLSHINVNILTPEMADRLGLKEDKMGLTPGDGSDRQHVYVFYGKVEALAEIRYAVATGESQYFHVTKAVILGHAMAHEIGHVLLSLESHSPSGIMRAHWNMKDLLDGANGRLLFTASQSEIIRADVGRRLSQERLLQSPKIETPGFAQQRLGSS
jgi:hypothetical protein